MQKLIELPHSLAKAQQEDEIKALLTDYQRLCAANETGTMEGTMKAFIAVPPKVPLGR